jgi:cobalt/nickel transport system permease protein
MSHLHIPDGVLPLWLIGLGWLLTIGLATLATKRSETDAMRRRVPLVGAMAALMLVGMTSEIVPIAYHVNLTVVAGILLGPWLSIISALVVDVMLSLVGHGGATVVGLNTLIISTEMIAGWALFHALVRVLGPRRVAFATAIGTFIALALSTTLLVGIVALGGAPAASRESGAFDPSTLRFDNPFSGRLATNVLVTEEDVGADAEPTLSIRRFATMVYTLGSIGWLLESLITALIVSFVARVRPSLVFEGAAAQRPRAPVGDEGVHH